MRRLVTALSSLALPVCHAYYMRRPESDYVVVEKRYMHCHAALDRGAHDKFFGAHNKVSAELSWHNPAKASSLSVVRSAINVYIDEKREGTLMIF